MSSLTAPVVSELPRELEAAALLKSRYFLHGYRVAITVE